jgi:hypothetical protein
MSTFFHRASGLAFGGEITSAPPAILEAQAPSTLPPIGGLATTVVGAFNHGGIVLFSGGSSEVTGDEVTANDGSSTFNTRATATVNGLNVLGKLTVGTVVAQLIAAQQLNAEEVSSLPTGSYFSDLRIDGTPVNLVPVDPLFRFNTVADLGATAGKAAIAPQNVNGNALAFPALTPRKGSAFFDDCALLTYLFQNPAGGKYPYVVPGLGNVYFGEFLITRYSRRLTMLRIELAGPSGESGEVVCAVVEGNGGTY